MKFERYVTYTPYTTHMTLVECVHDAKGYQNEWMLYRTSRRRVWYPANIVTSFWRHFLVILWPV